MGRVQSLIVCYVMFLVVLMPAGLGYDPQDVVGSSAVGSDNNEKGSWGRVSVVGRGEVMSKKVKVNLLQTTTIQDCIPYEKRAICSSEDFVLYKTTQKVIGVDKNIGEDYQNFYIKFVGGVPIIRMQLLGNCGECRRHAYDDSQPTDTYETPWEEGLNVEIACLGESKCHSGAHIYLKATGKGFEYSKEGTERIGILDLGPNQIIELPIISECEQDIDQDSYFVSEDCNDCNSNVHLGLTNPFCDCSSDTADGSSEEICTDEYDNDCDGDVNEGCDADGDRAVCENNDYMWEDSVAQGHQCCGDDATDYGYSNA